jgi:protein-tyrosine phosphatase
MDRKETVVFVCSGNFYRSRFAEAVFNHHALWRRLPWRAESRGFTPHLATAALSPATREALELRNIPPALTRRKPALLTSRDLDAADLAICLKEAEHRPLMESTFPDWAERVHYWHIHDIDVEPPRVALPALESRVLDLISWLDPRRKAPAALAAGSLEF